VYFQDDSYDDKRLMTGRGVDGVLYTFEVIQREPIPIVVSPSDGFLQRKKSDKDFTEPYFEMLYEKAIQVEQSYQEQEQNLGVCC
jgi:hypothetical protein